MDAIGVRIPLSIPGHANDYSLRTLHDDRDRPHTLVHLENGARYTDTSADRVSAVGCYVRIVGERPKLAPCESEDGLDNLCNTVYQITNFFNGRLCRVSMAALVSKIAEELNMAGLR